ncbi:MAG: hypothetical protein ACTHKU_00730 [Verrucomicrobiota bacterium]
MKNQPLSPGSIFTSSKMSCALMLSPTFGRKSVSRLNLTNQITNMSLKPKKNCAHNEWWIIVADKFENLRFVRYPKPFATPAAARRLMNKLKRLAPAWRYGVCETLMLPNSIYWPKPTGQWLTGIFHSSKFFYCSYRRLASLHLLGSQSEP